MSLGIGQSTELWKVHEALDALPTTLRLAIEVKAPHAIGPILDEIRNQGRQRDVMVWSQHESPLRVVADAIRQAGMHVDDRMLVDSPVLLAW